MSTFFSVKKETFFSSSLLLFKLCPDVFVIESIVFSPYRNRIITRGKYIFGGGERSIIVAQGRYYSLIFLRCFPKYHYHTTRPSHILGQSDMRGFWSLIKVDSKTFPYCDCYLESRNSSFVWWFCWQEILLPVVSVCLISAMSAIADLYCCLI